MNQWKCHLWWNFRIESLETHQNHKLQYFDQLNPKVWLFFFIIRCVWCLKKKNILSSFAFKQLIFENMLFSLFHMQMNRKIDIYFNFFRIFKQILSSFFFFFWEKCKINIVDRVQIQRILGVFELEGNLEFYHCFFIQNFGIHLWILRKTTNKKIINLFLFKP